MDGPFCQYSINFANYTLFTIHFFSQYHSLSKETLLKTKGSILLSCLAYNVSRIFNYRTLLLLHFLSLRSFPLRHFSRTSFLPRHFLHINLLSLHFSPFHTSAGSVTANIPHCFYVFLPTHAANFSGLVHLHDETALETEQDILSTTLLENIPSSPFHTWAVDAILSKHYLPSRVLFPLLCLNFIDPPHPFLATQQTISLYLHCTSTNLWLFHT